MNEGRPIWRQGGTKDKEKENNDDDDTADNHLNDSANDDFRLAMVLVPLCCGFQVWRQLVAKWQL